MALSKYRQKFNFPPKVKARPRMTRSGRAYTPEATLEFERKVREAYAGPLFEGPVSVTIILEKESFEIRISGYDQDAPSKLRGDIDNYAKAVLDGLNKTAFDDDKYVRELVVLKNG